MHDGNGVDKITNAELDTVIAPNTGTNVLFDPVLLLLLLLKNVGEKRQKMPKKEENTDVRISEGRMVACPRYSLMF